MRRPIVGLVVAAALVSSAPTAPPSTTYRVEAVHGKLVRLHQDTTTRLAVGSTPEGGDRLRTGWFSRAELSSPAARAHFALGRATTVRLADGEPGLLLEVERGRLRALLEALAGLPDRERLVATPSAVLAVRGTSYGVEVDRRGDTTVAVFAGTVQVRSRSGQGEPVMVGAGQAVTVRRDSVPGLPRPHRLDATSWDRGASPRDLEQRPGTAPGRPPGPAAPQAPAARGGGSGRHGG